MKNPIKLHWASSKPNFGDYLSPLVVECISGRKVVHSTPGKADLLGIGRLLQRVKNRWWTHRTHIWGSGFIEAGKSVRSRHFIHAVRGPLSAARLSSDTRVYGDPGLLVDRLLDGKVIPKKHRLSVIAHYQDKDSQELKQLLARHPDANFIDVFSEPRQVLSAIAASHFVLSSAMHGLIAADGLGVPNARIVLAGPLRGGEFKFDDYYRGIGIDPPRHVKVYTDFSLEEQIARYWRPELNEVKEALVRSFPDL